MRALRVNGLSYSYNSMQALFDVSFTVKKGSYLAILGHNGSGKTTLLYHLNGTFLPQQGEIQVFDMEITKDSRDQVRKRVGLLFDNPDHQLFSTAVFDDVAFGPRNLGILEEEIRTTVEWSLNLVGASNLIHRPSQLLSYGQKKKVALAGVLAMKPDIIVLDEIVSGVDPSSKERILSILKELHKQGVTLIMSTHDMDGALEWADEVLILKEGRILTQGLPDLLYDRDLIKRAGLEPPTLAQVFHGIDLKPFNPREANDMLRKNLNKNLVMGGNNNESQVYDTAALFDLPAISCYYSWLCPQNAYSTGKRWVNSSGL